MPNNSINIPTNTPIKYKMLKINKFSFKFLFLLNKTNIETPLPVNKPDIQVLKFIALFINNSVNKTLAPQFGIKPINEPKKGENKLSFKKTIFKKLSLTFSNKIFTIKDAINIKINVLKVCLKTDLNKLCLQSQCSSSHKL